MKKVVFMIINMNVGGTEKALLNMISQMPRDKFDISILMLEKYGGFLNKIPKDVRVNYIEYYEELKYILNNPPQYSALQLIKNKCYIKGINILLIHILTKIIGERNLFYKYVLKDYPDIQENYDIAVAYAGPMELITYFVLNKIKAKKKVQWIHFDVDKCGFNKDASIKNYKMFDKIFVVSDEGKNKLVNKIPELKDKIETFFNVISPKLILEQAENDEGFSDEYDGLKILTVGRLTHEKGQELCIEALKRLRDDGYNAKWYCIGDGASRNRYEEIVKQKKLEKDFIFLGSKTNPYSYMKQCDIYVQPSLHEGYCITLAEAKCFGKAIVTTDFTGAREQIIDRMTGIIVDYNSNNLYMAIKQIIDDYKLRNKISKNVAKTLLDTSSEINKFYKL
ncbi:glycosyltransferase [uncultured Clostridium sp.]|uniref:glycosyltransferase n=1 Tax=uncultured Clostridium sp. TaxID=59620 RepID=UPI0025F4FA4C|nr:glycosyltransferase [uncultured Clostridium sp.]